MGKEQESFRQRLPNLADRLLYQRIMQEAGWDCTLGSLIDHGGMSSVYELNMPQGTSRQVVKVIDTRLIQPSLRHIVREHGLEECTVMRQLSGESEFIMPLYASTWTELRDGLFGRTRERIYLLRMPRVRNLYSTTDRDLTETELIQLGMDISRALHICYLHDRIHRDVKPGNIFVRKKDGRLRYILGDFGIARIVDGKTLTGVGTENFLAPELCSGWISRNSDIYSLGVTLFVLAGGHFGPGDKSGALARGNTLQWQDFKRRERISPELMEILRKALQDKDLRYQQPYEMFEDLWWLQKQMYA